MSRLPTVCLTGELIKTSLQRPYEELNFYRFKLQATVVAHACSIIYFEDFIYLCLTQGGDVVERFNTLDNSLFVEFFEYYK